MKKMFILISSLILSQAAFSAEKYAFECTCNSVKKVCENLENLNVLVDGTTVSANVGNEDWEFNTGFDAKASKLAVPSSAKKGSLRFDIVDTSYLIDRYLKGSVIVPATKMKKAQILLIDKKTSKTRMSFKCVEADPAYF